MIIDMNNLNSIFILSKRSLFVPQLLPAVPPGSLWSQTPQCSGSHLQSDNSDSCWRQQAGGHWTQPQQQWSEDDISRDWSVSQAENTETGRELSSTGEDTNNIVHREVKTINQKNIFWKISYFSKVSLLVLEGNMFDVKKLDNLEGFDQYMERYTAVKRKMD